MDPTNRTPVKPPSEIAEIYTVRLKFLMESSDVLASCLDREEIFSRLAHLAVPFLADWCSIVIIDDKGALSRVGVAHIDPEFERRMREVHFRRVPSLNAKVGIPLAIRTGKSELLREVNPSDLLTELNGGEPDSVFIDEISRLGLVSMMTVPLKAHGQILGAISMYVGTERPAFEPTDLALAEELARRASLALYSLNRLEHIKQDRELLEVVIRLNQNFVVSRVEDTKSPLTAATLKIGLLLKSLQLQDRERKLFEEMVDDVDRAITSIGTLAEDAIMDKLLAEAKTHFSKKSA